MERKKEKTGAWHNKSVPLDFISVYGPLRAVEGVGVDVDDELRDAIDTLEIPPNNADIYEEWTTEVSQRAGRIILKAGHLLDEHERSRGSVFA